MSKITSIETVHPADIMPNLLLLRVTTEDGFVGYGETYYTPQAIAALVHDWMAERLLGADALAIESHWRFLYERSRSFGQPGAEMRALSAVDLALWDILGQACRQPVWQLLGGAVRPAIRIYNTCAVTAITAVAGNAVAIHHGRFFDGFQNLTAPTELTLGQYPLFALVGLVAGLFAILYMRSLVFMGKTMANSSIPLWTRPMLAGLAIAIVAIWLPNLLGLVEETTTQVIQDRGTEYVLQLLCFLIVFKIAATALCLSCGMHGGVFGPALCIGAMVGAALALAYDADYYQIFALAGMGACISSVVGAPIATILIVFELNQNYSVATAVMVAVVISNLLTNKFFARSYFLFQVQAAGVDINAGREVLILQHRTIREVMETEYVTLNPDADLATVEQTLRDHPETDIYVIDSEKRLLGSITLATAWDALKTGSDQTAADLATLPEHILTEETDLNQGFEIIEEFVGISLPVVKNTETMHLTGIIHEANIIQAYNEAVKTARGEEQGLE